MKGFFEWFKSSTKMKRWMLLILVGIILACYGISEILVSREINFGFFEIGKIIISFVIGFICIVLGIVFINKRNLELLIEATDERMENKNNVNVKSLIFNKTVYDKGPKIVVIGGGAGLNIVLSGIKSYTSNITAIATVSEYGKVPSNSRTELDVMPLEDVKNSMISLVTKDGQVDKLFNYQFNSGKLKGLSFSDIYFSAMKNINGDFSESVIKSNEVINMVGKVIPVTLEEMKICAELDNGYVIEEKDRIAEIAYEKVTKINRIYLDPSNCKPAPGVIEAIREADCIVIGPGSLYTNVIPNLLVNGISKEIKTSKAIKIYVSNIMTEPGQTDNFSVADHVNAIIGHCGEGIIDYCIYDTGEVVPEFIKKYNMEGRDIVEQTIDGVNAKGIYFMQRNLSMISQDRIRHDPILVAASIIEIICDDLKYQDKQNDPQYLMMNTKLKSDKRIEKIKKLSSKTNKKYNDNNKSKKKSKFSSKYSDRIASIKEADEKIKGKSNISEQSSKLKKKEKDEDIYKFNLEDEIIPNNKPKEHKKKEDKIRYNDNRKPKENKVVFKKYDKSKDSIKTKNITKVEQNVNIKVNTSSGKTPEEIREEMMKKLQNSRWNK